DEMARVFRSVDGSTVPQKRIDDDHTPCGHDESDFVWMHKLNVGLRRSEPRPTVGAGNQARRAIELGEIIQHPKRVGGPKRGGSTFRNFPVMVKPLPPLTRQRRSSGQRREPKISGGDGI